MKILRAVVDFLNNKEAVLFWVGGVAAIGQFLVGWITTGEPDTYLWSGIATFISAVLARYLVFSKDTVEVVKSESFVQGLDLGRSTKPPAL